MPGENADALPVSYQIFPQFHQKSGFEAKFAKVIIPAPGKGALDICGGFWDSAVSQLSKPDLYPLG